jgi:hypothetical protein
MMLLERIPLWMRLRVERPGASRAYHLVVVVDGTGTGVCGMVCSLGHVAQMLDPAGVNVQCAKCLSRVNSA